MSPNQDFEMDEDTVISKLEKERDDLKKEVERVQDKHENILEMHKDRLTILKEREELKAELQIAVGGLKKIGVEASIAKNNGCNLTRDYIFELINETLAKLSKGKK